LGRALPGYSACVCASDAGLGPMWTSREGSARRLGSGGSPRRATGGSRPCWSQLARVDGDWTTVVVLGRCRQGGRLVPSRRIGRARCRFVRRSPSSPARGVHL